MKTKQGQKMTVLVDSGAGASFIGEKALNQNNTQELDATAQIKLPDGRSLSATETSQVI